jgi:DNA (cytosine-5)-methyltransferase 1|tara:strand:+ start:82 stop:915 length:834 start_codon:yes stop_codon:yes gene_type:complete
MRKLRTLDLFAGIGGFSLGLHRTGGFETVAFVERDDYAQKVLAKNFPDVPIFDDVRTFDADGLGRIDVITGGFPCQPWSVAGKREGHLDTQDRDLWPKMASIIEELQPKWVIGENVQGFVNKPMGLARTLADLESIGYQSTYWILPAAGVGAPHRRNRVFILAHTRHGRRGNIRVTEKRQDPQKERSTDTDSVSGSSKQPSFVADTDNSGRGKQRGEKPVRKEQSAIERSCRWLSEPRVGRVAHGIPNRVDRLKGLGNAVVPQIVTMIGYAILEAKK